MTVETGSRWVHKREGYAVEVQDLGFLETKTKAADAANWDDAVPYVRDDEEEVLYTRAEDDFLEKFEPEVEAEDEEDD